jgi:hypothetical protein
VRGVLGVKNVAVPDGWLWMETDQGIFALPPDMVEDYEHLQDHGVLAVVQRSREMLALISLIRKVVGR